LQLADSEVLVLETRVKPQVVERECVKGPWSRRLAPNVHVRSDWRVLLITLQAALYPQHRRFAPREGGRDRAAEFIEEGGCRFVVEIAVHGELERTPTRFTRLPSAGETSAGQAPLAFADELQHIRPAGADEEPRADAIEIRALQFHVFALCGDKHTRLMAVSPAALDVDVGRRRLVPEVEALPKHRPPFPEP